MARQTSKRGDSPEVVMEQSDKLAHIANDAIVASAGAVAGGIVGAIAGPVGVVAGASLGALAGGLLQHQADKERHEKAVYDAELDDIDVEEEFFHEARALGAEGPHLDDAELRAPIEIVRVFKQEHREIERLLTALENWAASLDSPTPLAQDRLEAARLVLALRGFVAGWHHAREEDLLFDALESVVPERERGMVLAMKHEHRLLERFSEELDELSRSASEWTEVQRQQAIDAATRYTGLLRNDMRQEEGVLYPLAETHLSADARSAMNTRLETYERTSTGEPIETLRRMCGSLCAAYARDSATASAR